MTRDKNFYEKRYEGKPFLLLLDSYVLDVIGELPATKAENLRKMEPFLQKTFKHPGKAWRDIVVLLLNFPSHVEESIRSNWAKNQKAAAEAGLALMAEEYAIQFVDFMAREAG